MLPLLSFEKDLCLDGPLTVQVLLPLPFSKVYSYVWTAPTPPLRGTLVTVPFGNRRLQGVVWAVEADPSSKASPPRPLKEIEEVFPEAFPPTLCEFWRRLADYTLAPLGSVLKMSFGSCGGEVIRKKSPLSLVSRKEALPLPAPSFTFSDEQATAIRELKNLLQEKAFSPLLLEGLTGSGKTEVYFEAIFERLQQGFQVLILLPEIALTSQFVRRFEKRFGFTPYLWHADLPSKHRHRTWEDTYTGKAHVVVGARSALFLPYKNLGLIVVDEEHDSSYKQEEGVVRYHGRDMAILRASLEKLPILLVSATPSLETLWNVSQGRYAHLQLTQRFKASLPHLSLLSLEKNFQKDGWISKPLREKLKQALEKNEQSLLFLNRRGYAPYVSCKNCGHLATCPQCQISFVYHKKTSGLLCHYCGQSQSLTTPCGSCGISDNAVFKGPGVEKLKEEVSSFLPTARVGLMSSDHVTTPKKLGSLMQAFEKKEIDLLIGTQLVAKGHHFPSLTCVGIIDGDTGLGNVDFRAQEKMMQLLTQVSGRAGRGEAPGFVYLQTQDADHDLLQALLSQNQETWIAQEMESRKTHLWPPWGRLASVILSCPSLKNGQSYAMALARSRPEDPSVKVLGPIPAPLFTLRGRYRWRFLIRAPRHVMPQPFLKRWIESTPPPSQVSLIVDIDPYQFM